MRKLLGLVGVAAWAAILIIVIFVGGNGSQSTNPDGGPASMVAIYFFVTAVQKIWMVLGRKDKEINTASLVLFVLVVCYLIATPTPSDAQTGEFTTLQLVTLALLAAMPVIDACDLFMQFFLPKKW